MRQATEATDVLILGAGAAGLAAARVLARAGIACLVLEARDRTGGRISMAPGQEPLVALGAEFLHGTSRRTLALAAEAGLAIETAADAHFQVTNGTAVRFQFWEAIEPVMAQLRTHPEDDQSFDTFLQRLPERVRQEQGHMARDFVEGYHAANAHEISETALALATHAEQQSDGLRLARLRDGFSALIRFLEHALPPSCVRLGTVVRAIRWQTQRVDIRATAQGAACRFTGRQAIVTLPLGVLQATEGAGSVRFEPPLADKRAALPQLRMGSAVRCTLDFAAPFWATAAREHVRFFHLPADALICWTWPGSPAARLIAWQGGPRARALAQGDVATMLETVLRAVSRGFGIDLPTLRRQVRATYWHAWDDDPYARGAYSYVAVGGHGAQTALARPVQETLFFAGEATHDQHEHATVEGAIATGERAANEILALRH